MNIKSKFTILIALFLGLFFVKGQTLDSLSFRLEQDSTTIDISNLSSINKNLFWKQHVMSNVGGGVIDLSYNVSLDDNNLKSSVYNAYLERKNKIVYNNNYKFSQIDYKTTIQEGQYISALHSQAYKNFSFGIFYQKQISEGHFFNDIKDHVNTKLEFNYHPKDKPYSSSLQFLYRKSTVFENGGFVYDSLYLDQTLDGNDVIETQLKSAKNTLRNTDFNWVNALDFHVLDSLKIKLTSETSLNKTSEFYQDSPLQFSNTGTQPSIVYYPNVFRDSTATSDSIAYTNVKQSFSLETQYKGFTIKPFANIEFANYNLGFGQQSLTKVEFGSYVSGFRNKFQAYAKLLEQTDLETGLELKAEIKLAKKLIITGLYADRAPELLYQKYQSNHFTWDNAFSRENHMRLEVSYQLLKHTKISGFYHKIKDFVYLNENINPIQDQNSNDIKGIELESIIRKGNWTFANQYLVQSTTGTALQKPTFIGRLKIAFQRKMLGEALVQPGVQINYASKYFAPKYMSSINQTYLQTETKIGGAPKIDVFVNMKVSNFTIYGIFTNVLESAIREEMFVSPHIVGLNQRFNFGIRWNFYDH
ncbi:MAG: putative porin [Flavobacteriales bacterium]